MAYQYSCSACEFEVRSEDDDEVVDIVQSHASTHHDMSMSADEVRDGIEEA